MNDMDKGFVKHALTRQTVQDEQTAWFEDGEAFHAFQLLQQEREEWERDRKAQKEYQQHLDQLKQEEQQ